MLREREEAGAENEEIFIKSENPNELIKIRKRG